MAGFIWFLIRNNKKEAPRETVLPFYYLRVKFANICFWIRTKSDSFTGNPSSLFWRIYVKIGPIKIRANCAGVNFWLISGKLVCSFFNLCNTPSLPVKNLWYDLSFNWPVSTSWKIRRIKSKLTSIKLIRSVTTNSINVVRSCLSSRLLKIRGHRPLRPWYQSVRPL